MSHLSDRLPSASVPRWIEEARGGAPEAVGRLLQACREYLLMVSHQHFPREIQGKVNPSDLVQETFLKAQRNFTQFQGTSREELLAWLRAILVNTLNSTARTFLGGPSRQVRREINPATEHWGEAFEHGIASPEPSPASGLLAWERDEEVRRALDTRSEESREVIRLRHWEQLSFAEVGERLGRSAEAARKLWARAVRKLRQALES